MFVGCFWTNGDLLVGKLHYLIAIIKIGGTEENTCCVVLAFGLFGNGLDL